MENVCSMCVKFDHDVLLFFSLGHHLSASVSGDHLCHDVPTIMSTHDEKKNQRYTLKINGECIEYFFWVFSSL